MEDSIGRAQMIDPTPNRYTLLADIGGTNTRVALAEGNRLLPETISRYANAGRPALEPILTDYMESTGVRDLAGACVAVAGPVAVDGQTASMTNLDWTIGTGPIARATKAEQVFILNDLQAQGYALGALPEGATRQIVTGRAAPHGASQLVIGIGTGFNAAPVHEAPGGRLVAASECGHASLPILDETDIALMRFVEGAHGFPGVEDVLSGRGLERVHAFVTREAGRPIQCGAAEIMGQMEAGTPDAIRTGALFVRMMGMVVGDLALIHLPFGGIYLCGGVARALTPYLERFGFETALCSKGRFSDFMRAFPVAVIEDDYAALTGCAAFLSARLRAQ